MTISTLIDSNGLIDILAGGPFFEASRDRLFSCTLEGSLILSVVVFAELSQSETTEDLLRSQLSWLDLVEAGLPFSAGFVAGKAQRTCRQRGGRRECTLPDFLTGAHALVGGHRLLARDAARYRDAYPALDIVTVDAAA